MQIINMGMLSRNTSLAEYMAHINRNTLVKYYVKRRENKEFAILETTQSDNLFFTFLKENVIPIFM